MLSQFLIFLVFAGSDPSWTLVDSGISTSIRGISAVDRNVCWIGTESGVARTVDGGKFWHFSKIGDVDAERLDFRDLHAFDAENCIAMSAGTADASRIYRTGDGGKSWKLVHRNAEPEGFFNGMAFRDERHGILAGDPIGGQLFLLATDNGGNSWHRIAKDTAPKMGQNEHAFAASGTHLTVNKEGHIWVTSGGNLARVFHSDDWGETWRGIDTPMIAGEPSTGIFSIAFHGKQGIAVGGDYNEEDEGNDNVMRSDDGGMTWKIIRNTDNATPFPFRSCIGYIDAKTLVTVGPSGSNLSRSGGATWHPLPGNIGFHTLSIGDDVVWAAGAEGRIGVSN